MIELYRFDKQSIIELVTLSQNRLKHTSFRDRTLPPVTQVLIALKFFATGISYRKLGELFRVSPIQISRTIRRVVLCFES